MSERKVLNKYYPPDFDPSKIPRLHLPKDRQYTVRLMAPCNMKCKTCGEYIYKGKKFNARKETVQGEEYLGIKIFRFYIKCTRCLAEITFKTDPQNADYIVEHGATRNFQALKLAEEQAEREQKEREEEEASNPMKLLENRTKASKLEMEMMESLQELREMNQRHAHVDYEKLLELKAEEARQTQKRLKEMQDEEDEAFIQSVFYKTSDGKTIKRILDDDDDSDGEDWPRPKKTSFFGSVTKPTDLLVVEDSSKSTAGKSKMFKSSLAGLVKLKKKETPLTETKLAISCDQHNSAEKRPESMKASSSEGSGIRPSSSGMPTSLSLVSAYSDDSESGESS